MVACFSLDLAISWLGCVPALLEVDHEPRQLVQVGDRMPYILDTKHLDSWS